MKRLKKIIAIIVAVGMFVGMIPVHSLLVRAEDERTLTFSHSGIQDEENLRRYLIYLNVDGTTAADTLPGNSGEYWNNNTVYLDGKAVSGDGVNYATTSSDTQKQIFLCLQYKVVEATATKASDIGIHLLHIPAGTVIGGITTANDIYLKIDGTSVSKSYGVKLTRSGGGNQPGNSRYQVIFDVTGVTEFPNTGDYYWTNSKVFLDGIETAVPFLPVNSTYTDTTLLSFAAYIEYNTLLSGATSASEAGKHLIEIPSGTFFGDMVVLETVRVLLVNGNILDVTEQELVFTHGGGQDANSRYLVYLGGCVAPATGSWGDNDVYIDDTLVEGLEIASQTDGEWFLILPYEKIPNCSSTASAMGSHKLYIPKGSVIGNYITTGDLTIAINNNEFEVITPQISLDDFGIGNGTYGDGATETYNTCSSSLVGKRFQVSVTPSTTTAGVTTVYSSIYYATKTKGSWDGLTFGVRADGLLTVINKTGMTSVKGTENGSYMMYPSMSEYDAAMDKPFLLELFLDFVDYQGDGNKNDAYFRVKINDMVALEDYFLEATEVFGDHILIYGNAGNKMKLKSVLDTDEVENPFEFTGIDKDSYMDANGNTIIEVAPSIGIPGNPDVEGYGNVAVYSGLPVLVGDATESTTYEMTKTDHGTFRFTIPKADVPTTLPFTVTLKEGPMKYTKEDETVELNLISDYVVYVNQYGISGDEYITCAGEDVQLIYSSGDVNGIYLTTTDSMTVTGWTGSNIYASDDVDSGFFLNGEYHQEVYLKKTDEGTYYVALSDVELTPKVGDVAIITGKWELDTVFVDFATIALKYNGSAWEKLEPENGLINGGNVSRDTSDDEWLVDGANATVNGDSVEQGTVLYKPGDYVINSTIGDVTMSQTVSLYHPGDVNANNAYEVADLVRVKKHQNKNSADTVAGQLAADVADLTDLRKTLIGKTKTDDALPTEIVGATSAGTYITSVDASANGTTVISMSDSDNGYQAIAEEFDDYGFDYVISYNDEHPLRILQLTDTQTIDSSQARPGRFPEGDSQIELWAKDKAQELLFDYIDATVKEAKPDLILLTGDIVYGEFDDDGSCFKAIVEYMDSLKIPWAPVYGNHENESRKGVEWQNEQLTNSPYCLFNARHEIEGNGNYTIGIAHNGTLERVVYMMDSNYCGVPWWDAPLYKDTEAAKTADKTAVKTTPGFSMKQKNWYRTMALRTNYIAEKTIPSIVGYHVPHVEYLEGAKAACYQSGTDSDNIKYTIGKNVVAQPGDSGYKGSMFDSNNRVEAHFLDYMHEVGTDGTFVGHQHSINTSIYYDGIRWTYGVKTGEYCDYPSEMGGTLINLSSDSSTFEVERIIVNP